MVNRRGISNILASIILISIAVATAAIVYSVSFGAASHAGSVGDFAVTEAKITKTSGGTVIFSFTIRNTGTVSISALSATVKADAAASDISVTQADMSPAFSSSSPLSPGQQSTYSMVESTNTDYTIGKTYPLTITVTFVDGSTKTTVTSLVCESA